MKRILIATLNPGKLRDFRGAALSQGIDVVPVPNLSALPSVIEDGVTFEANACKKAEHYSRYVPGEIVLVDTGPLVALLNRRDRYHSWARRALDTVEPPIFTCEAVLSEACFLLGGAEGGRQGQQHRGGAGAAAGGERVDRLRADPGDQRAAIV